MKSSPASNLHIKGADGTALSSPMRRQLLGRVVLSPLLLLGAAATARAAKPGAVKPGAAKPAATSKCVDMNALTSSQQSLRETLGFKLETPDPTRHCSLCSFFTATDGGCGTCTLLTGGAVSANSVCDSFAAKA
jgi:High potential iron-sulfur protein